MHVYGVNRVILHSVKAGCPIRGNKYLCTFVQFGNLGIWNKTFGFMQIVDSMQPGGLRRHPQQLFFPLNTKKIFPLGSKFQYFLLLPLSRSSNPSFRHTKITHQSQLLRNGHSKFQISQYQLGVWINEPPI